jgi:hypothetical protein
LLAVVAVVRSKAVAAVLADIKQQVCPLARQLLIQ